MHSTEIEIHGDFDPRFEPVVRELPKQLLRYGGGAAASVFHEGECVVDVWAGQARHDGTPWAKDTMSLCFSTSKGVAATAIHILATDGLLDYDAPVARYWPEFGQKGKEVITVRQVLAHQAGLHKTAPLIAFYAEQGLLVNVDASGSVEDVGARLQQALTEKG